MSDVIEPVGLLEIFCDGFDEHELQGHNISCLGFRNTKAGKVAVVRLTFPATAAQSAIEQTQRAIGGGQASIGLLTAFVSKLAN